MILFESKNVLFYKHFRSLRNACCSMFDVWCMMHDAPKCHKQAWRLPRSPQNVGCMRDAWCIMYDVWCMMYDVWFVMRDAWCMMYDVWCVMREAWSFKIVIHKLEDNLVVTKVKYLNYISNDMQYYTEAIVLYTNTIQCIVHL